MFLGVLETRDHIFSKTISSFQNQFIDRDMSDSKLKYDFQYVSLPEIGGSGYCRDFKKKKSGPGSKNPKSRIFPIQYKSHNIIISLQKNMRFDRCNS